MTEITIIKSKNGEYKRVTCKGHAGFDSSGKDIVCSAISILVINTINSLDVLTDTRIEVNSDQEKGLIDCSFPAVPDEKGTLLLDSMVLGLKGVVSEYGGRYLKLKFKEV